MECKKGKSIAQPPILYVPPPGLHERQETKQIKVKMPDGTNFQMTASAYGNNKDYLVHIIAVLRIIEQKGMALDIKKAWGALVEVRREMKPFFEFPENKTEAEKEVWKQTLSEYKEILKVKKNLRLLKPRRHMKCSVALSSAIRKLSGTRLSTRCIPRTPGLV